ncbi:alpha/beta hydrolase [Prescottella agglutinans]|uniref:Alpha/beta hydrolase n=1 Tax=Prescottella agglutinans TaxID=1644129 RepID=A0A438BCZ6_9NOCA|nr:alpha/beta hydrolase [Prescottella agglutinans]RVW08883.1 alpha/beta hydrolase [Prescottella agglutinans]
MSDISEVAQRSPVHHAISRDGTAIAYERSGDGAPIIIVGGAFNDRTTAAELAAALAPGCTAIAYDRRGRGSSGDTTPYAVEREIEDLAALIEDIGGSASLYGLSSGAILALDATAAGLPVSSLAIFEPPLQIEGGPQLPEDYLATLDAFSADDRRGEAVEYFMTAAVGLPPEAVAQTRQSPAWAGMEAVAHTLRYDGAITVRPLTADRFAGITVPTLTLASVASPPWLQIPSRTVAEMIPGARYLAVDGGFHDVPPATLAPLLFDHLAGGS